MTLGKTLYSEIFYNHQPIMPFLSFITQKITQPDSLYQLILYHRLSLLTITVILEFLILLLFRYKGLVFIVLYNLFRFYYLGDRFLPEALAVYLLVILLGLYLLGNKKISLSVKAIITGICAGVGLWLREPYVPAFIFIFIMLLIKYRSRKFLFLSSFFFVVINLLVLMYIPIQDYIFVIFKLNGSTVLHSELNQSGVISLLLKSLLYPLLIFTSDYRVLLSQTLIILTLVFFMGIIYHVMRKQFLTLFVIIGVLSLAGIRYVAPGKMFYESFHMLPWFGLFLYSTIYFTAKMFSDNSARKIAFFMQTGFVIVALIGIFSNQSFLRENINTTEEFNTGYARYSLYGDIIKQLGDKKDSLFVDLWDDIVYWTAGLPSSYQYSLYTPLMESFYQYNDAKKNMLANNKPTFYYCSEDYSYDTESQQKDLKGQYMQIYYFDKPMCLYVQNNKISQLTDKKMEIIRQSGITWK
jgi:hypothetical protein